MNKAYKQSSYEGYRRLNRTNSVRQTHDLFEVQQLQHSLILLQTQNMASQLQNNVSQNSFHQEKQHKRRLRTATSLININPVSLQNDQDLPSKEDNFKRLSAIEIIQESHSFCQDEPSQYVRQGPQQAKNGQDKTKIEDKKAVTKDPVRKTTNKQMSRKPPSTYLKTPLQANRPSDKGKLDISELDSMRKELECKKQNRQYQRGKGISGCTSFRKANELIGSARNMKQAMVPQKDNTQDDIVPMKMLTDREKKNLVSRLMVICEVLDTKQVSCELFSEIDQCLLKVEKLLTL